MDKDLQKKAWNMLLGKIRELLDCGKSQAEIARMVGVHRSFINKIVNGDATGEGVRLGNMLDYLTALGVDSKELFGPFPVAPTNKTISIIGLAVCGYDYWYKEKKLAFSVTDAPPGSVSQNMFAVLAEGTSMQPAGICAGYIVFCDPDCPRDVGDAVFVERENKTMSLKIYAGTDGIWTILEGWLPPDQNGVQHVYTVREQTESLVRIAPVIYVKRK